ncbi:MAG: hypothetical protein QM594_00960 [Niabella sp.]
MRKIFLIILACVMAYNNVNAQQNSNHKIMEAQLLKILEIKHDLEKPVINKNKGKVKKAFSKTDYLNSVKSLKGNQAVLEYLNKSIEKRKSELSARKLNYNYVAPYTSVIKQGNIISVWVYYKIVQYSLFEKGADSLLPLKEIPFMAAKVKAQESKDSSYSAEVFEYLKKIQAEKNKKK